MHLITSRSLATHEAHTNNATNALRPMRTNYHLIRTSDPEKQPGHQCSPCRS